MPKAMRPVVKIEDGAGGGHAEERRQEEADAEGERQRRRVNEAGDAVSAEAGLMFRDNAKLQAQAIEGMERTRVLGEELQQAKVQIAELAAEVKMRDEALQAITKSKDEAIGAKDTLLQAKEVLLQSKDALLQSQTREMQTKDLLLQAKDVIIQSKDALLQAKDHADTARLSAQPAVGGAARQPAPAPAAQGDAAAQGEALFQEGQRLYGEQRFSEAAERWGRAALLRHGPSHAHASSMLCEGRTGVAVDKKRAFELAAAGAASGCAHRTARAHSAAATLGAMVLPKTKREGLRWEGRALRRAAALGSLWLECATALVMAALRRTMPRLCDSTALQQSRGMHRLSAGWAPCF